MVYIARTDGVARLGFENGTLTRASVAWSPDSGQCVQNGIPRITSDRIPILNAEPRLFYSFDVAEAYMGYSQNNPPGCTTWYAGASGRQNTFESDFPEFTKLLLGSSYNSNPIYAYRLVRDGYGGNPLQTKHFVICCGVHGNEMDGINGAFKAVEILARHSRFQAFRKEWTLLFIPTLNPDGWSNFLRNLAEIGPNGNTVNLNRQGDWFWNEYVESASESKGSAPWSSSEGTALYAYYASVVAAGGSFGVFLDMHATEGGGGARYLTRDRNWTRITGLRGASTSIPSSYLAVYIDYYLWLFARATTNKRLIDEAGPDLWIRLIRSRFSPKVHSYFSSQGVFSIVIEEAKVATAPAGTVSYKTACDFRLDFVLATAICCTASSWSYEKSILLEKGTTNLLPNASFKSWQTDAWVTFSTQYSDNFNVKNLNWWITMTWTSTYLETIALTAGFARLSVAPVSLDYSVECDIYYSNTETSATVASCYIALRATFDAVTKQVIDGYKLQFNKYALPSWKQWRLLRVNGGVETSLVIPEALHSSAAMCPTTTPKKIFFRARYTNPVEFQANVDGVELFDTADFSPDRITDINYAGLGGSGGASPVNLRFDNFVLQTVKKTERPGYYTYSRGAVSRATPKEGEKFLEDNGECAKFTSYVDVNLYEGSEFCSAALCQAIDEDSGIGVVTSYFGFYFMPPLEYRTKDIFAPGSFDHPTPVGAAIFGRGSSAQMFVVGGGTSNFTGAGNGYTEVWTSWSTPSQVYWGVLAGMPALMHMGFCDNSTSFADLVIVETDWRGYMFGGMNAAGTYQNTVVAFDGEVAVVSTAVLPKSIIGCAAVYNKDDDCAYIFGGRTVGGPITDIYKYDCGADTVTDLTGTVALPKALMYMAAALCPGDKKIYIFGGEEASGDMSSMIYAFDPVGLTIIEESFTQNLTDEEGEEEGVSGWIMKIGRWTAVTRIHDDEDYGVIVLVGGRQDSNVGTLLETVYIANLQDKTISLFKASEYGYLRHSSNVTVGFATQVSRSFDGEVAMGAGWSDPGSGWTIGSDVATSISTTDPDPAICLTTPTYINQRVSADVSVDGNFTSFSIILRGIWTGATLTSGYELAYTFADETWRINRYVAGTPTEVASYDASASASRRPSATPKKVLFRAMLRDPVEFYAYIVSSGTIYTLFAASTYDYDLERIVDLGNVAFSAQGDAADVVVDNFLFETGGYNEEKFTASSLVKAASTNISGYYRWSLMPSSLIDGIFTTRYCSQYYYIPTKIAYYWARGRADLRNGLGIYREERIRYFLRTYKEAQTNYYDGVHLAKGTLIPTSFHGEGLTRSDESMTFADVLNPNCFQLSFYWMPTFAFNDIDDDLEIARVSIDTDNYISLSIIAQTGHDRWIREFVQNSLDGPHEPVVRLTKVQGAAVIATADVVCYFGASQAASGDPVNEACEDVIKIQITNQPWIFELAIFRGGLPGQKTDNADLTPFAGNLASFTMYGIGYFTEPQINDLVQVVNGRQVPARRKGFLDRFRRKQRPALIAGDRDPTNGVVAGQPYYQNAGLTFGPYDTFTRVDNASLGSRWLEDIDYTGWNILSNKAHAGTSFSHAQMAFPPRHADVRIVANVAISGNGTYVGLRARFGYKFVSLRPKTAGEEIFGYEALILRTGPTAATLFLLRYHRVDVVTLDSQALSSFTDGEPLELIFDLQGTTLTATVTGRATMTVEDSIHKRARNICITGNSVAGFAEIDDIAIYANFNNVGE
jgi:hypothetical protein